MSRAEVRGRWRWSLLWAAEKTAPETSAESSGQPGPGPLGRWRPQTVPLVRLIGYGAAAAGGPGRVFRPGAGPPRTGPVCPQVLDRENPVCAGAACATGPPAGRGSAPCCCCPAVARNFRGSGRRCPACRFRLSFCGRLPARAAVNWPGSNQSPAFSGAGTAGEFWAVPARPGPAAVLWETGRPGPGGPGQTPPVMRAGVFADKRRCAVLWRSPGRGSCPGRGRPGGPG